MTTVLGGLEWSIRAPVRKNNFREKSHNISGKIVVKCKEYNFPNFFTF